MKRSQQPAYWQLDLFVLTMISLLVGAMMLGYPAQWDMAVSIGWSVLIISGMSVWVYVHRAALAEADRAQRSRQAHGSRSQCDNHAVQHRSLGPVQHQRLHVVQVRNHHNN
jgi:hypothetical protein